MNFLIEDVDQILALIRKQSLVCSLTINNNEINDIKHTIYQYSKKEKLGNNFSFFRVYNYRRLANELPRLLNSYWYNFYDNSLMLSSLCSASDTTFVKQQAITFIQNIIKLYNNFTVQKLYYQIIVTPINSLNLVNVCLFNNQYPHLIHLGKPIIEVFENYLYCDNISNTFKHKLLNLTYFYQPKTLEELYSDKIINLIKHNFDFDRLTSLYKKTIEVNIDTYKVNKSVNIILDLNWLINTLCMDNNRNDHLLVKTKTLKGTEIQIDQDCKETLNYLATILDE